jgi:transposase
MMISTTVLDPSVVIEDPVLVVDDEARPDPEVPQRARRRTFTAKYKLEVLAAYDAASDGEKGAVLRREGLYSSHLVEWRRARDGGALAGLTKPRGRPARDRQQERITELEREKRRLKKELAKARFVVDVQAKRLFTVDGVAQGGASIAG